jgi:tetratricopeptide (TPR) repeat protein/transcriptional regulator with XRE-family HTH domain
MDEGPDDREPFGCWVRRQREAAGLTQEELANRSGLSARTISNLERGLCHKPYPRSVRLVACALGLAEKAVDELIAGYRASRGAVSALSRQHHAVTDELLPTSPDSGRVPTGHAPAVPRQLPAALRHFAGRAGELAILDRLLDDALAAGSVTDGAVGLTVISGSAGVGKSALAVHWAHRVSGRFPDGQLYVNLRGYGPSGTPATSGEVIRGFLSALGVPPLRIPAELGEQAGLYRSMLARRRVLIVADNAREAAQVRPLLPGSRTCLVVVTSRSLLGGLAAVDGAQPLILDVFSEPEAAQLLAARLGAARLSAEPEHSGKLIAWCARLPLALSIVAARAVACPDFPLAALAAEMEDSRGRLDKLDAGDPASSVRAVFSWSYSRLREPDARMYRLMGVHPGPDISVPAAASLAGACVPEAKSALSSLAAAGLITECSPGRFAFHDLLRAYAADQSEACDDEAQRHAAIRRCLDHYLRTAQAAAGALDPAQDFSAHGWPESGLSAELITDSDQALAWFTAEHRVLLAVSRWAAEAGFSAHAQQLSRALVTFLGRGGHWPDLIATQRLALACAQQLGDSDGQARAHCELGRVHTRLHQSDQARRHLTQAIELSRRLGDKAGEARAHLHMSVVDERAGCSGQSLSSCLRALGLARAAGDPLLQANACNNAGFEYAVLGDLQLALSYCRRALRLLHRQVSSPPLQATVWDSLGGINHQLGHYNQAVRCYLHAIELFGENGDHYSRGRTFSHLGDTYHASGESAAACESWQQALASFDKLRHPDAASLRSKLADLRPQPAS